MSYDETEATIAYLENELNNVYGGAEQEINGLLKKFGETEEANYKEYQQLTKRITELENRITEAKRILEYAIKSAKGKPQPQDMKIRLIFDFDVFNSLCAVLSLIITDEITTNEKNI